MSKSTTKTNKPKLSINTFKVSKISVSQKRNEEEASIARFYNIMFDVNDVLEKIKVGVQSESGGLVTFLNGYLKNVFGFFTERDDKYLKDKLDRFKKMLEVNQYDFAKSEFIVDKFDVSKIQESLIVFIKLELQKDNSSKRVDSPSVKKANNRIKKKKNVQEERRKKEEREKQQEFILNKILNSSFYKVASDGKCGAYTTTIVLEEKGMKRSEINNIIKVINDMRKDWWEDPELQAISNLTSYNIYVWWPSCRFSSYRIQKFEPVDKSNVKGDLFYYMENGNHYAPILEREDFKSKIITGVSFSNFCSNVFCENESVKNAIDRVVSTSFYEEFMKGEAEMINTGTFLKEFSQSTFYPLIRTLRERFFIWEIIILFISFNGTFERIGIIISAIVFDYLLEFFVSTIFPYVATWITSGKCRLFTGLEYIIISENYLEKYYFQTLFKSLALVLYIVLFFLHGYLEKIKMLTFCVI